LDLHDDNEVLKRDLEMKNRLIEKLMKENANLREEMEGLLATIEEAKSPRNLRTRNFNNRILELEHQIDYLEGENKALKQQLQSRGNNDKEVKIKQFEDQVGKYCETAKKEAEEFYSKFQQQLKFYTELSKHHYDDFSKTIKEQIDELKENKGIPFLELKDQPRPSGKNVNMKSGKNKDIKKNTLSFERRNHTEESLTPTPTLPLSTRSNTSTNLGRSAKKVIESAHFPAKAFKNFVTIDENPELVKERRGSTSHMKTYQVQNKLRKGDNEENITPFRRNSTVHKSLNKEAFTQKLHANSRASTGITSNEKRNNNLKKI